MKYGGWRVLAELLGQRMATLVPPLEGAPLVVPVPTTPRRRRVRGYNQARLLAEVVACRRRLSLLDALERPEGRTQVHLTPRNRAENVRGAFRLNQRIRSRILGREVILVDDVLTTAATAVSAAQVLEEGGVTGVHLLTFARALPFSERGGS
ncbi:ComF family protein [Gemmatimonadota bacterium]